MKADTHHALFGGLCAVAIAATVVGVGWWALAENWDRIISAPAYSLLAAGGAVSFLVFYCVGKLTDPAPPR